MTGNNSIFLLPTTSWTLKHAWTFRPLPLILPTSREADEKIMRPKTNYTSTLVRQSRQLNYQLSLLPLANTSNNFKMSKSFFSKNSTKFNWLFCDSIICLWLPTKTVNIRWMKNEHELKLAREFYRFIVAQRLLVLASAVVVVARIFHLGKLKQFEFNSTFFRLHVLGFTQGGGDWSLSILHLRTTAIFHNDCSLCERFTFSKYE